MERKIQLIDAEKITSVTANDLRDMFDKMSFEDLQKANVILSEALSSAAGNCARHHWHTDEEQNLFNHFYRIFRNKATVERG